MSVCTCASMRPGIADALTVENPHIRDGDRSIHRCVIHGCRRGSGFECPLGCI